MLTFFPAALSAWRRREVEVIPRENSFYFLSKMRKHILRQRSAKTFRYVVVSTNSQTGLPTIADENVKFKRVVPFISLVQNYGMCSQSFFATLPYIEIILMFCFNFISDVVDVPALWIVHYCLARTSISFFNLLYKSMCPYPLFLLLRKKTKNCRWLVWLRFCTDIRDLIVDCDIIGEYAAKQNGAGSACQLIMTHLESLIT